MLAVEASPPLTGLDQAVEEVVVGSPPYQTPDSGPDRWQSHRPSVPEALVDRADSSHPCLENATYVALGRGTLWSPAVASIA